MEEKKITIGTQEFTIKKPNAKIRRESDAIYAKAYRKAVMDGFFLEAEIDNIIKERGIKAANEKEKKEIDSKIAVLEGMFNSNSFSSVSDGLEKYQEILILRREIEELDKAKRELSTQAATIIAENERFAYFVHSCSFDSEGAKVWQDFKDYKDDNSDVALRLSSEMIALIYDGASTLIEELEKIRPENVWFSSVNSQKQEEESEEVEKPKVSKKVKLKAAS